MRLQTTRDGNHRETQRKKPNKPSTWPGGFAGDKEASKTPDADFGGSRDRKSFKGNVEASVKTP
jgi:hypothetical protein